MSGTLPFGWVPSSAYLGPSGTAPDDPTYSFGQVYQVPKYNPPATYTGQLSTPPADYGSTIAELPHDYHNAIGYLRQTGQYTPEIDQWLQAIYLQRKGRT